MWIEDSGGTLYNTRYISRFWNYFNPTTKRFYVKFRAQDRLEDCTYRVCGTSGEAQAVITALRSTLNRGRWVFQEEAAT